MKVSLAQINIVWEDKEKNKELCKKLIIQGKEKNSDLIIFPEMTLTGFSMNVSVTAEKKAVSSTIDFFKACAIKYKIAICFGYVEFKDFNNYNKLILIDSLGNMLLDYAKLHPFSYGAESLHFSAGNSLSYCNFNTSIISGLICYDLRFPEIFQLLSNKSDIIIVIANWPSSRLSHWDCLLKARAIENQCYIIGVNRVGNGGGLSYNGHSAVYSPYGELLTKLSEFECLISCDIDVSIVSSYRNSFPLKNDRKENLYIRLMEELN